MRLDHLLSKELNFWLAMLCTSVTWVVCSWVECWFVCFEQGALLGFEAARCVVLVVAWRAGVAAWLCGCAGVGGLLFENCIVDASIFWKLWSMVLFHCFLDCVT